MCDKKTFKFHLIISINTRILKTHQKKYKTKQNKKQERRTHHLKYLISFSLTADVHQVYLICLHCIHSDEYRVIRNLRFGGKCSYLNFKEAFTKRNNLIRLDI